MTLTDLFSFVGSGERKTLDRVVAMLDLSIESTRHLLSLVRNLKNHDLESVKNEFSMIVDLEQKTNEEHRSLVRVLCTGSFFGGIREDLLGLLEFIDNISDASKHSAMIFHDMDLPRNVIDYFFQEDVESFISTCIDAAQLLKEAIEALEKNKNAVLELAEKIKEKEAEADEIHHGIVRHLFKNEIDAKSLDIILLQDFLHLADDIADSSKDGSDVLQILVAKGYS